MTGYPEYYTIVYRNDQRMIILNDNPEARKKIIKKLKRAIPKDRPKNWLMFDD